MLRKAVQRILRFSPVQKGIGLAVLVFLLVCLYQYYNYAPYLESLSVKERTLYEELKATENKRLLEGAPPKTIVKLFLHSVEKEEWQTSSLFYLTNEDGTFNTAFGPVEMTSERLKMYRKQFEKVRDRFGENPYKPGSGSISLRNPAFMKLQQKDGVWYIEGVYEQ